MTRWLYFAYALACYGLFNVTALALCAFTGDFLIPKTIDSPATGVAPWTAAAINVALLLAFGVQHSVMARPAFKRAWTRLVPQPIERSTYLLASCAALALVMWLWQPLPAVIWHVESSAGRTALWTLFAAGWLMVPAVSYMINHFDLFGLRQAWLHLQGRENTPLPFRTPYLYAYIRHPIYVGWTLAFWATPTMTLGHLLFAGVLTAYMALAAIVEERDLVAHFGSVYEEYRRTVPRYLPRLGRLGRLGQLGEAGPGASAAEAAAPSPSQA
ncbi:MAG TPA: isoprenylcysteine carboxylmethyltransferase family protein [Lacipirellulaceae bacterium]|nr:isoprenylcysteine carboxylmethyltransferase family protein [Lacipirellulaceae bacterium]